MLSNSFNSFVLKDILHGNLPEYVCNSQLYKKADFGSPSKENAYLNCCYHIVNKGDYKNNEDLYKEAKLFNVVHDVEHFQNEFKKYRKSQHIKYAYPSHNLFPLNNKKNILKSAELFEKFHMNLTPEMRYEISKNINCELNKIAECSNKKPSVADLYHTGIPKGKQLNKGKLADKIKGRSNLAKDAASKGYYQVLGGICKLAKNFNEVINIMHSVEKMDKNTGIYPYNYSYKCATYESKITSPQEPLMEVLDSLENMPDESITLGNNDYTYVNLARTSVDIFEKALGDAITESIRVDDKMSIPLMKDVLPTLPESYKELLDTYLQANKVS